MEDRNNIVYHIGFIIIVIRKAIYRLTSSNNRCRIRLLDKERGKGGIKMETEIWKSLPRVPGVEASTLGRVRTLDKMVSSEKYTRFTKGRILKQYGDKGGYLLVGIQITGKWIMKKVHRLVAQTFIPNPDSLPQVNHRDCNRANNNVENLEWCDNLYNVQYQEKYGKTQSKPLLAINLATLEVSQFQSQSEASQELGVNKGNINSVIKGNRKQAGGYYFVNADDNDIELFNKHGYDVKMDNTGEENNK